MSRLMTRRGLIAGTGYAVLAGTTGALAASPGFRETALHSGEALSYRVHRLIGRNALAPEFAEADLSPDFRTNGNTNPDSAEYRRHREEGFATWALVVDGLVDAPQTFPLERLRAMRTRTQITRHDCVEGWSAIGKWTGVPLAALLDEAGVRPEARYAVFHCADAFGSIPYYESIDMADALHPQTMLAHTMNDAPLSVGHGAPLRLRVERQLGYKHAKFVMRVELTDRLAGLYGGRGGYWEDRGGYDWYAGI